MNWFKSLFKKERKITPPKPPKKEQYVPLHTYEYKRTDGTFTFKLGDKVIGRSNECDPLLVGEIVEFWDNEGKWNSCIPYVKDEKGKVWGVMGIMRPYSEDLMEKLSKLKPLEQWNYFVPKEYQYNQETIERKEKDYEKKMSLKNAK